MPQLTGVKREIVDHTVAIIGHGYGCFHELAFLSDANFHEYSTIILDPAVIDSEINKTWKPPFGRAAHDWITTRSEQLTKWLATGHNLVVIVRRPSFWPFEYMEDDGHPYSERVFSEKISLYSLPIFQALNFKRTSGNRVDFIGRPILKPLIQPSLSHFEYEAIVSGDELEPILRVRTGDASGNQLVGCRTSFGKGQLICMPPVGVQVAQAEFLKVLAELPRIITPQSVRLPDWVDSFCAESELITRKTISDLVAKIQSLELELSEERNVAAPLRELKCLFTGSGDEFKDAVKAAIIELGLQCTDGPHPRADLLASSGTLPIAIEAKGLDGNARENNFRQVERWKAEVNLALSTAPEDRDSDPDLKRYAERLRLIGLEAKTVYECKGLMVIGTFRNTQLNERNQPDFPEPVIRLLLQSNVCALTGLQLFCLIIMARRDPLSKEKILASLVGTSGVLDLGTNWREFLRQQA